MGVGGSILLHSRSYVIAAGNGPRRRCSLCAPTAHAQTRGSKHSRTYKDFWMVEMRLLVTSMLSVHTISYNTHVR